MTETVPKWASEACMLGIDEAGRGPVLGPMVYACLYCAVSFQSTLASLEFADSKTLKEEKRDELFESLKANDSIGWAVDVIDPRDLSSKMLKKSKINLNEISHDSAIGLVTRVLNMGVLLTQIPMSRWELQVLIAVDYNVRRCGMNKKLLCYSDTSEVPRVVCRHDMTRDTTRHGRGHVIRT